MTLEKLPIYVNIFPDGHITMTCAHCAVDAQLEGARVTTLYTEHVSNDAELGRTAILWESDLSPEQLVGAAARQCKHLAGYGEV